MNQNARLSPRARLSDEALLDLVQRQTLDYFLEFGHPISGMARERSNPDPGYDYLETVSSGGTGFGIMAMLAGVARDFAPRNTVFHKIERIVEFLSGAEAYHGVFPHFMNGTTGRAIEFSEKDDGGDLVETSFLMMGLLCARQLFSGVGERENRLRAAIDRLWHNVEWDWHTNGRDALYWHWSPRHGWDMDHAIRGWNECLMTYLLAASSPTHAVEPAVYHRGWANSAAFLNGQQYYDIGLPLGPPCGGPLFFSHFSFLGLDPRGLRDRYADYWEQNRAHTLINRAYCISNSGRFSGYGPQCWGLTACDGDAGYGAFCPNHDRGVIAPTAALSAMPYTPAESMTVLRFLYEELGDKIWGRFGFVDAFNLSRGWVAESHLAIDQGPIVVMIENARSGLLWKHFMSCPEIHVGLDRLGFSRSAR